MVDQEAVLDALYNRVREPDFQYQSTIKGSDVTSLTAGPEDSSVPKDVCLTNFKQNN